MPNSLYKNGFIELNRTFHELSQHLPESDSVDISRGFLGSGHLGWPDLIREYRVVLLSEAGSGKTEEVRNIARKLCDEGKAAFFIRLEHIPNDFEAAFEVGDFEQFQDWLMSGEEGWLLLDSVDEARLRSPRDFELAIRKLSKRISAAKERSHIVITGRPSAWRPKTDLKFCTQHLPLSSYSTAVAANERVVDSSPTASVHTVQRDRQKDSPFRLVALDDLSLEQIKMFASMRGITDSAAFFHAVERADARSFTARPQDLEELARFWIDNKQIGSRLELMRNSINRRLKERCQDRAEIRSLSSEGARQGVRLLAAAATMGQVPNIRVPDGANNSKGIPVGELLPDWNEMEQGTLLSLPIFDEAIYGTVRFHHRSVREYLTAEWLAELLGPETSRRKIEELFFRRQYGMYVIVPKLRPVLPWLAILDDNVGERLLKIAPEVVFEGGDPSQLPLETRRTILDEVCEQLTSGNSSLSVTNFDAAQRFANADLANDIRSLIKKYDGNDEQTGFLLRMIRLGELAELLPEAKVAALSVSNSTHTRVDAIRAVKAVGSEEDVEEIRQKFLKESPELKRVLLAELVHGAIPSPGAIEWLLAVLDKTAKKERKRFSFDNLADAVKKFVQRADATLLPQLVFGLNELLNQPPAIERRYCQTSKKFRWLLKAAAQAVERLIRERHRSALEPAALSVLHKCRNFQEYGADELRTATIDFATLVPEWPDLNRALFWYEIEQARTGLGKKHGRRLDEFWRAAISDAFWRFGKDDFDYVVEQMADQKGDNRLVALSLAFRLYVDVGRHCKWRERLKVRVASDSKMSARLNSYLHPPPQEEEARREKRLEASLKRRAEQQLKEEKKYHADWKENLAKNVENIRDPRLTEADHISDAQTYLLEQLQEKEDRQNRWTDEDWKFLIDEYGADVAYAFTDGAVDYWRRYKPTAWVEGAPYDQTPPPVVFGIIGISIEAKKTTDWPASLSEEEVNLACRYASHELDGFPTWFPQLFKKHRKPVGDFLVKEITYELSIERPDTDTHYILEDVSLSGEWAWNETAPRLMEILADTEPANLTNLRNLLNIIQGASIADEEIKTLAARKSNELGCLKHLALWYAVWAGVDPDAAIPSFSACIEKISEQEHRTDFAMTYVTGLCGGRRDETVRVREAFKTPRHLKSLYLLMHKYIRRRDDIERAGKGVYTPGLRDNAQDARESLLTLLNEIPGKEAFWALEEISTVHPEEALRSRIARLAKAKAENDADIGAWAPSQVREFQDEMERTPANHGELFELATMRLLDLKDDLENGDSSIAEILQKVTRETEIRKFIGRELRGNASGRYSIPQEEELADAKRLDLGFIGSGFDGSVPVELKLADNWSGPELFKSLESQLCGDYLRDNRSNSGIFVLVYRGEKKGWDVPNAEKRVEFSELVAALQIHWQQISSKFPGIDDIVVVGIDLTKRSA